MSIVEEVNTARAQNASNKGEGGLPNLLARHASLPDGVLGYLFGLAMKRMNREPYEWILQQLVDSRPDSILEIGFGSGYGIQHLSKRLPQASIYGVEHSATMLATARRANRQAVLRERVRLMLGEAHDLPVPSEAVARAFCIHVTYFWQDPSVEFSEIYRVLKPGGKLLIFIGAPEEMRTVKMTQTGVYHIHSPDHLRGTLLKSGFSEVQMKERAIKSGPIKHGICLVASKCDSDS